MPDYADLLIRLYRQDDDFYGIELRYYLPNSVIEADLVSGKVSVASLNALDGVELDDPYAYGARLKQALLSDSQFPAYLSKVLGNVEGTDRILRLRLQIPVDLAHLHGLHWETMPGLDGAKAVAIDQNHPFSRFLAMDDWREIELRPKSKLSALVVVANPKELDEKDQPWRTHLSASAATVELVNLKKIDVKGEIERARTALSTIPTVVELESRNPDQRPTLENITRYLSQGFDILYLVCHGALIAAELDQPVSLTNPRLPKIILEDEHGSLFEVNGRDLADAIHYSLDANLRPRLVVLSSCQSAGDGRSRDQGALAALGPLLVRAGVPAVVAMQSDVLMETANKFVPRLFEELLTHGMLDKAMAAARLEIDQQEDWWAPVLFTCLRGGQLFYDLGFAKQDMPFDLWPNLIQNIRRERYNDQDEKEIIYKCTPVIGPDLSEFLMGTHREIAHRWSAPENFENGEIILNSLPSVAAYLSANPDDLPYFAQYLAVQQSHDFVPADMIKLLRTSLVRQNKGYLPEEILAEDAPNLRKVIKMLGKRQHAMKREAYPYHILASLPFTVYLNANPDNLLEEALIAHGRKPVVEYSRWNPALSQPFFSSGSLTDYTPSEETPLIFHMFGNFRTENSLVLSEDDYFEYLVNVNSFGLPVVVQDLLNAHTLLFLGFRLSDWSFRVLFHSLLDENRKNARQYRLKDNKSIAVQLQPSDRITRPELVRSFLEKYLPPEFKIYWGPAELFLTELWEKYPKKGVYACQISQG